MANNRDFTVKEIIYLETLFFFQLTKVKRSEFNQTCNYDKQCSLNKNLTCTNGLCLCQDNLIWNQTKCGWSKFFFFINLY